MEEAAALALEAISEQVETFLADGFVVVRSVLGPEQLESVVGAAERVMSSGSPLGREDFPDEGLRTYREAILLDDGFLELLAPAKVFPLVVAILGANIQLLGSHLIYLDSAPTSEGFVTAWHRDRMVVRGDLGDVALPRLALKVGYYLTDARQPTAGTTLLIRGSHRFTVPIEEAIDDLDRKLAVRPALAPGDAVIFENRTWHAQGCNTSGHVRKAIMMEYGFRWLRRRMREQLYPERLLDGRDPVVRQILGDLGPNADFTHIRGSGSPAVRDWCDKVGLSGVPARDP